MDSLFDSGGGPGGRSERVFFVSALLMVIASYLFHAGLRSEGVSTGLGVGLLLGLLQVYELALLILAGALARVGQRRGAQALLALGALFLIDPSFLTIKASLASPGLGLGVIAALIALLPIKLALWRRSGLVALSGEQWALLGLGLVLLWCGPLVFGLLQTILGHPERAFHALLWLVAAALAASFLLKLEPDPVDKAEEAGAWRWLRFAPAGAFLFNLAALAWAHDLPLSLAHGAPVLALLAVLADRDRRVRGAAMAGALILSAFAGAALGGDGLVTPYRITGLVVAAFLLKDAWLQRQARTWALGVLALVLPLSGGSPARSLQNLVELGVELAELGSSAVPRGALAWALLLMVGSFALLGFGAVRSLRAGAEEADPS